MNHSYPQSDSGQNAADDLLCSYNTHGAAYIVQDFG